MSNYVLTNKTTSHLDMSPLTDMLGRPLALRAGASVEVDEETYENPIAQRVIGMGWVTVGSPTVVATSEPESTPEAPAAPPALEPEVKVEPEVEPEAQPAPPALPPLPHEHDEHE